MNEWLEERRRIHNAATEGPWAIDGPAQAGPDDSLVVYPKNDAGAIAYVQPAWDDADAIVDAHNVAVPVLLTAVEKVLFKHTRVVTEQHIDGPTAVCEQCSEDRMFQLWPCETVRAIEGEIK